MKKYKVKQNKNKPIIIMGSLALLGALLLFSSGFGIPFASVLQLVGVGFIVAAISIFTGSTVSGGVEVAIDDRPDDFSIYPKLYIYTTKGGHDITNKRVMLKFTQITAIMEGPRKEFLKQKSVKYRDCIYANFLPERVYSVKYECYDVEYEVLCDFDAEVAREIALRIEKFSGLEEDED